MKKYLLGLIYLLNISVIVYFWWHGSGFLFSSAQPSLILLALARLAGLLGMFSVLVQYALVSHNPWLERTWPYLRLAKVHQYNGLAAFGLISTHVVLMAASFKLAGAVTPLGLPWVWLAAIAYMVMLVTVVSSVLWWLGKLNYRVWVPVHVFNYLVVPLAFWHQIANGGDFLASRGFLIYWWVITILALANLTIFRLLRPHQRLRLH